ncbi:NADP-dependent oxidoreductase [Streptomyces sp. WAC05374]|uniref:NADP-dependent oxidoreductase n=1 Tax=Streptomyces sp. WAC05374 TaxID=2487420 RepID=UPI000F877B2E|nr:NADP-dependent oxidoreductase [Streptomyces sp. WAC05374]RST15452.1 NADP-dependent oxidoreductase [Streptomyces sp. WAC05374]TDF40640.1 NADP-dependent oxidoreductase [Streptomyces sp. WAC05374]TDF49451.1 NADP-dependent oxidoreductase [Streptomyces sp. WAC05374]TDF49856.1 NADP-dependent oxidoreductase [Streptomyces sp. WAC05374]
MKAISYRHYGGPEVLAFGDHPDPKVGPDKVLVEVRAAAVSPVDVKAQAGYLDTVLDAVFPVVPGWDVSGVVVQPGVSVPEFAVGDEVMGYVREDVLCHGTFAEYVAAPVRTLARKPRTLGFEEAAALPLAGLTAYQVLHRSLRVGPGDTVLVNAASGGVGSMAVQIARHLGARVIGAAREGGQDRVRELGAEPVPYGDGFTARVRQLAPKGVDAALDTIGGQVLKDSAHLLAPAGRLASVADGEVIALGGEYYWVRPDPADLTALAGLAEQGALTVRVARTFPLEQAADAQRALLEGGLNGKVVVTVGRND